MDYIQFSTLPQDPAKVGFEAQIRMNGLPMLSNIENAEANLESGSKSFGDILDPFLFYGSPGLTKSA